MRDFPLYRDSLVVVHGLSWSIACGILVPRPRIEPASPALQGGFLTTGLPGKSPQYVFNCCHFYFKEPPSSLFFSVILVFLIKIIKRKCLLLSCVHLFATPWTIARQSPLSMEFSRPEYWMEWVAISLSRGSSQPRDQT